MKLLKRVLAPIVRAGSKLKPNKSHLIAFFLGALSVAAFAPLNFSPLMLLTIAGLFYLWQQSPAAGDGANRVLLWAWFFRLRFELVVQKYVFLFRSVTTGFGVTNFGLGGLSRAILDCCRLFGSQA
ncbi:hypothetical protein THIOSC13_80097 [uncultured Thiomicrorhabdus sp.]